MRGQIDKEKSKWPIKLWSSMNVLIMAHGRDINLFCMWTYVACSVGAQIKHYGLFDATVDWHCDH